MAAQVRAGVDVVTDGEQRRDNYASFVGGRLDNCQLIPLTDLLPLVDDPEKFEAEMRSLDVPAGQVRHPALFGPLGRSRPLAGAELDTVRAITDRPVKVALPGPYLLTRTMWMECISDRAYRTREHLAEDIVRVLREEVHALLAGGAALVQLDEPVLAEVVFTGAKNARSFMCGALSEKGDAAAELAFATELINRVTAGLPRRAPGPARLPRQLDAATRPPPWPATTARCCRVFERLRRRHALPGAVHAARRATWRCCRTCRPPSASAWAS